MVGEDFSVFCADSSTLNYFNISCTLLTGYFWAVELAVKSVGFDAIEARGCDSCCGYMKGW
jgi:hypothetical protein